jgi:hypothetical protein
MCRIIVLKNLWPRKKQRRAERQILQGTNAQQKGTWRHTYKMQAGYKKKRRHKGTIINVEQAQIQRGMRAYIKMFMLTMCRQTRDMNEKTITYENKHKHTAPPVRRLTD